jgi:hypothetical protein
MSDEMPLYDVYAEEENICSIGSCNVSDTNLVIQQDGEGKPEIEHTPKYFSNPSENEIQQPPMSATATHQILFETSERTPNSNVYEKEDIACLNIISDVLDFTLELQHQHDERACKCPVLKAYHTDVTRSSHVSIDHSMSEYRLQWDPRADTILSSTLTRDNVGLCQTSVAPRSTVFMLNDVVISKENPVWCTQIWCPTTMLLWSAIKADKSWNPIFMGSRHFEPNG